MTYDYSQYTRDDIIKDLFMFTDALDDEGNLIDEERAELANLKERWYKLCTED